MTTTSPDDNTSVPSRPVKATPEQLRHTIKVLFDRADTAKVCNIDSFTDQILALFATFLASIELPKKIDWKKADVSPSDYNYAIGYNQCLRESQAIIDKLVEELRHGAN